MIDRIHIEQLEIFAQVGVSDSERAEAQRLSLNVTLWPEITEPRDEISDTVNYSEVAESVKQFIHQQNHKLIETLAEQIAAYLLTHFRVRKVELEVRKFVLPGSSHVSVTAVRQQAARQS